MTWRVLTMMLFLGTALTQSWASLYTLDWLEVDWVPSTAPSQFALLEDVDGSGIDVSVSLLIDAVQDRTFASPTDTSDGYLLLAADYHNINNLNRNYIDVTFSFSAPVHGVSFSIENISFGVGGAWEDVIRLVGGLYQGSPVSPTATFVGSGIEVDTTSSPGSTLYRGISQNSWNEHTRLTLSVDSPVDTISFRYSSGDRSVQFPGYQSIGLSNITFHGVVPEPGTVFIGVLCLGWILLRIGRRRWFTRRS